MASISRPRASWAAFQLLRVATSMIRNPPTVTANTRFNTTRILPMMFMIVPQVPRRGVHDRGPFWSTPLRYYGSRMRAEMCRHPPALSSEIEHLDCSSHFGRGESGKVGKLVGVRCPLSVVNELE